jgi:hypothetical protein
MNSAITDRTHIPVTWFFIAMAALITTVFGAGMWASATNSSIAEVQRSELSTTDHLKAHDALLNDIHDQLLRISIATGGVDVVLSKSQKRGGDGGSGYIEVTEYYQ